MSSAKLYLQTNVVERLSRPVANSENTPNNNVVDDSMMRTFDNSFLGGDQGNVIDAATFIGALQNQSGRPSNAFQTPGPAEQAKQTLTKEEIKERQQKFNHFYERQQMMLEKKERSVEEVRVHFTFLSTIPNNTTY
jgi:hypothetical protein